MSGAVLIRHRADDGTITWEPAVCDGCDCLLTAEEVACGETLCEECRAEDEREREEDDR